MEDTTSTTESRFVKRVTLKPNALESALEICEKKPESDGWFYRPTYMKTKSTTNGETLSSTTGSGSPVNSSTKRAYREFSDLSSTSSLIV